MIAHVLVKVIVAAIVIVCSIAHAIVIAPIRPSLRASDIAKLTVLAIDILIYVLIFINSDTEGEIVITSSIVIASDTSIASAIASVIAITITYFIPADHREKSSWIYPWLEEEYRKNLEDLQKQWEVDSKCSRWVLWRKTRSFEVQVIWAKVVIKLYAMFGLDRLL